MRYPIYIYILVLVLFYSCKPEEELNHSDDFNRTPLLENIVDNMIIPSHNQLLVELNELKTVADLFSTNPSIGTLSELRDKWVDAYISWQYVEMFNIGKAEEIVYNLRMNTYPTGVSNIEYNILNEVTDLSLASAISYKSQGFPALDYMLYGLGGDNNLVINYYTGIDGVKYINYLNVLVNEMISNTNKVITYWQNNRNSFLNSTSNTATSSLNKLTNDFIYYYEKGFRANKIGIPAGVYSNGAIPSSVEAYYKRDLSKTLCSEALSACESFFIGKHFNTSTQGVSLKDYVDYIATNSNLSTIIIDQFENARIKINLLDDNFFNQIETNNIPMLQAFDAVQVAVVSLKTDMLLLLNISVDYVDADGD